MKKNSINELWLIKQTGEPLIHAINKTLIESSMGQNTYILSGLLSAIQTLVSQGLHSIIMHNRKLVVYHKENYFIVLSASVKSRDVKTLKILETLSLIFDGFFNLGLEWDGSLDKFNVFYPYLDKYDLIKAQ